MMKKVKVTIDIKGDKRKRTCWAKTVTAIDKEAKDGFVAIVDEEGELIWQNEADGLEWKKKKARIVELCEQLITQKVELSSNMNSEITNTKEYKFRAECLTDFMNLLIQLGNNKELSFEYVVRSIKDIPDVEIELIVDLDIDTLLEIMDEVEDGHRMWQTLTSKERYNGEILRLELTVG